MFAENEFVENEFVENESVENNINGYMLFGSGGASSSPEKIVICEKKDHEDYKIISKWIESI